MDNERIATVSLRLAHPEDIWARYDPEQVRRALRQSAGALAGVDREQLLADIRTQRAQAGARRLG